MNQIYFLISFLSLLTICPVQAATAGYRVHAVEFFVTGNQKIQWEYLANDENAFQNLNLQIYALDGIQIIKARLPKQLPADINQAKLIALQRLQHLGAKLMASM